MIYEEDGIKVIEYGHGSIVTACCELEDKIGLALYPTDPHPIGTLCENLGAGTICSETGADTMIFFLNKASFDMFYEQVEAIKKKFDEE